METLNILTYVLETHEKYKKYTDYLRTTNFIIIKMYRFFTE